MSGPFGRALLGFVAAVLSVLLFHETMAFILNTIGYAARKPWSLTPGVPPLGVPYVANLAFWGGLWGILFAFVHPWLPGRLLWLKGLIYGVLIVVFSGWMLVPIIKGQLFGLPDQVLFSGFNTQRMLNSLLIVGSYGLGLGIIYGAMARGRA